MGCALCSWFVCALMFGWVGCVFGLLVVVFVLVGLCLFWICSFVTLAVGACYMLVVVLGTWVVGL